MRSRKKYQNHRSRPIRPAPLLLETLDRRQLLNASIDWISPAALTDSADYNAPADSHLVGSSSSSPSDPLSDIYAPADTIEISDELLNHIRSFDETFDFSFTQNDLYAFDTQDHPVPLPSSATPAGDPADYSLDNLYLDPSSSLSTNTAYTLYLDFDGERVYSRPGDFWLGSESITVPAYDLTQYGWAGRESESINYILQFVQEDYAAYNITVTTEKPASGEYSTLYVGGDNSWFGQSRVIGVATFDVGNRDASNFGFAFSEELSLYYNYSGGSLKNFSEYLANLISHEAAHTYGADHVANSSALMNSYLTINPRILMFGGDDMQDTQALLARNLGYAHQPDDFGDDYLSAHNLTAGAVISGILERRDDIDAFTFTAAASGTATVNIDTTQFGNLDSYLTIYRNSDLATIAQNNNYGGSNDSFASFDVTAGQQYTIYVAANNADSSGTYSLELTAPAGSPQLVLTDSIAPQGDFTIDLGTLAINSTATATLTIANHGSADLLVSQLLADVPFQLDTHSLPDNNTDDLVIPAGSQRLVTVALTPTQAGSYHADLTLTSNDPDNPSVTYHLSAVAQPAQPDITLTASGSALENNTCDFGNLPLDTTAARTFTIRNTGLDNLNITHIGITEPFTITSPNGLDNLVITPGQQLNLTVTLTADAPNTLNGQLSILSNDPDQPTSLINFNAQIVAGFATVQSSDGAPIDSVDFGNVYLGETARQTVTVINTGTGDLILAGILMDGPFSLDQQLDPLYPADDISLAPGESTSFTVTYIPTATDSVTGSLTFLTENTQDNLTAINLQALALAGGLELTEADGTPDGLLDAGRLADNQHHTVPAWNLTNYGNHPRTVNLSLDQLDQFRYDGPDTIVVQPGQSYPIELTLSPDSPIALSDTVTLSTSTGLAASLTLAAQPYAHIQSGSFYNFIDHSGDRVMVMLSGSGHAQLTLGNDQQPDIQSIELYNATGSLNILVLGSGFTELGSLTGNAHLNALNASRVQITGAGLDLDGSINQLSLNALRNGADLHFAADQPAFLRVSDITGDSHITIDGHLRMLLADNFDGGSLRADSISYIILDSLHADIDVTNGNLENLIVRQGDLDGNININGSLGNLTLLRGDLLAAINTADDINRVFLAQGAVRGTLNAASIIKSIMAPNIENAAIHAHLGIDRINVLKDMTDTVVSIGSDTATLPHHGAASLGQLDAYLTRLAVNGTFAGSTVAVGITPDNKGNFINGSPSTASGTIASVFLGNIDPDNHTDPFGLIAQTTIGNLRVKYQSHPADYNLGDFFATVINR